MSSTKHNLTIPKTMMDKVHYFLKTFSGKEWSGPAWYSIKKDKNGYPTNFTLEYFHPLHLGTSSETDWDGSELTSIYGDLIKEFPKIGKQWVQGNIHSHHSMGAFYSETDKQQCIDGANENFYVSLVVSTKPGAEIHCGFSYRDQFDNPIIKTIETYTTPGVKVKDEWKEQAKYIKEESTPETPDYWSSYRKRKKDKGQASLFGNQSNDMEEIRDMIDYNISFGLEHYEDVDWDAFEVLHLDYEKGRIKKKEFVKKLKQLGVDEYGNRVL